MDAAVAYGDALVDDPDRFGDVTAVGLDETLRCRLGPWRTLPCVAATTRSSLLET
jgi:hypothetical protein